MENFNKKNIQQEIDYQKFIKIILSRWYWIAITLAISLFCAYTYLWYTPKQYITSAYLKFEDKQPNLSNSVTIAPLTRNYTNKILSESWTFKSQKVIQKSVENIDWQVSYFLQGKIRTTDLYPNKPFIVQIIKQDSANFYNGLIDLEKSQKGFKITYEKNRKKITEEKKFGELINIPGAVIFIKEKSPLANDATYQFKLNYPSEFYGRINAGLNINEAEKYSSIASVSKTDSNPYFAADALNAIIKVYIEQDLTNKTQSASQIINFIDEQLGNLATSVQASGEKLKNYKQSNSLVDLSATAQAKLSEVTKLETELRTADLKLLQLQQLKTQFSNNNGINLNFNLDGTIDPLLNGLITQWNELNTQKISLSKTYQEGSKAVKEVDQQLELIHKAAEENINNNIKTLNQLKNFQNTELKKSYGNLQSLPQQERLLFGLQRDYDINEKIYSYLSEKKLEAQISKASILPDASSIDPAQPNFSPISPVPSAVWRLAFIVGIASGIGLIFLVRLLNPYIYDKETIESITGTPIIGLIRNFPYPISEDNNEILTIVKPKSLFAESVRSVRTNLSFIANEKASKVIAITSEIAGEGKSFVTINIASSLALIDKKVIFIAADLRRSKIHKTFKIKDKKGLSTYLAAQNTLDEIIHQTHQENLDLIVSGQVPPNPAELMYSPRLTELIEDLKKRYDYILFDTAPIGLVSDALPLIRISDINLFVIRTGKSKLSAAGIPERITNEYQLNNSYIVLNDYRPEALYSHYYNTKYEDSSYGYYYADGSNDGSGYYTDEPKKKWWKKLFNS